MTCLSRNPEIALNLIKPMTSRMRMLAKNVSNLALLDVYGRVARVLLDQAHECAGEMVTDKLTQQEIADMEIEGQSGGGLVSVTMNGRHELKRVSIDDSLLGDDRDMLEDLIAAAVNDATHKVDEASREKLGGLAGGLNLPDGMKLPF